MSGSTRSASRGVPGGPSGGEEHGHSALASGLPPLTAPRLLRIVVSVLIPPVGALAAIHAAPLGDVAARRPGLLALGVLTLALAMLFRRLRSYLVIALAYGAALLALAGAVRSSTDGAPDAVLAVAGLYRVAWVVLFALAAFAGTLEAVRPGTVLAKRCLFAAAAIFLAGHGTVGIVTAPNALSLAAILAGACSLVAAAFSHRLTVPITGQPNSDIPTASALGAARRARLGMAEWRDPNEAR